MYKLSPYAKQANEYFADLISEFNLEIRIGEQSISLCNAHCNVEISIERYYPDMFVGFRNPKSVFQHIMLLQVIQKKGLLGTPVLTPEEKQYSNSLKDEVEQKLYGTSIVIKKHCSELLNGDFSLCEREIKP